MKRLMDLLGFFAIFSMILLVCHAYIFVHVLSAFTLTPLQRLCVGGVLAALLVGTLLAIPFVNALPRAQGAVLAWLTYPWLGVVLLLVTMCAAADVIWLLGKGVSMLTSSKSIGYRLLSQVAFGVAGVGCLASLFINAQPAVVKNVTIGIQNLPASFEGVRVVQLTDLHVGPMNDGVWLARIVDEVEALAPDMIVLTGDLVDGSVAHLSEHVLPLKRLKAKYGVHFVTGNHEYYSGADAWCAHLKSLGINVLRNACTQITSTEGENLNLVGVEDWGARHMRGVEGPDLQKALKGAQPNVPVILLAHQPAAIHEAAAMGVDLQLSGHTHGGQIWPFSYLVYLQQPYVQGHYVYPASKTQIYISPGTGFWGPPMRLGTHAEVSVITLRRAS